MLRAFRSLEAQGTTVSEETKSSRNWGEHRSERRILVHVPVEITEVDREGRQTTERTFIEDVSDFGCRFSTRAPVQQGDTLALKVLGKHGTVLTDEEPRYYEVMWVAPKEHGSIVGARVIQGEKLAKIKFAAQNNDPKHETK